MHIVAVPVLGIIINIFLQCVEANLTLEFKVTKISANQKPANCNVANTTYAHGETFKLDCKTQCVCENGRHACSSLCPKEQLPAPEDTISCRSPRLVEVPGHCCKMWLCENPIADVYATCHNSSTSPWTPCSHQCGLGISTRFTATTAGCNQLSNLRLCENRKCETQPGNTTRKQQRQEQQQDEMEMNGKRKYLMKTKQLKHKLKRQQHHQQKKKHHHHYHHEIKHQESEQQEHLEHEHRIRKGHECRNLQRLGPARIRLGQCVSRKLYRPKICGQCHQNTKCCVPSVSTTIQVELLCPLNAMDPISFVQQHLNTRQQHQQQGQLFYPKIISSAETSSPVAAASSSSSSSPPPSLLSLWDTHSLDAIDQEYLQSHQIQITNKFIAVEWILKCECTKSDNCQRLVKNTTAATRGDGGDHRAVSSSGSSIGSSIGRSNINNHKHRNNDGSENVDTGNNFNNNNNNNNNNMQSINYFKLNHKNNNNNNVKRKNPMYYEKYKQQIAKGESATTQIVKIPDDNKNVDKHDDDEQSNTDEMGDGKENDADNDSDININNSYNSGNKNNINRYSHRFSQGKQTKDYFKYKNNNNRNMINNQNNDDDGVVDDDDDDADVDNNDDDDDDDDGYVSDNNEENEDMEENEWSTSFSSSSLLSRSSASASGVATTSDEIQPDIIPYPPPPFSANKHTSHSNSYSNNNNKKNNYNNNKNIQTNWVKEKFKLEKNKPKKLQPEQYYEHWSLLQHNSNKPQHKGSLAT